MIHGPLAAEPVDWISALAQARDLMMPEVVLTLFACLALLLEVVLAPRRRALVAYTSLAGVALSALSLVVLWRNHGGALPRYGLFDMLVVDELALVFKGLFLFAAGLSIALSIRHLDAEGEQRGEYYALMLCATVGMMFVASGHDLLTLYVALELMAVSVALLVAFLRRSSLSSEAALKYLLLGAFSSGLLLYGMSLLYGMTGSTNLGEIAGRLPTLLHGTATGSGGARSLLLVGAAMMAAGALFKVAAVPFHMWAPDAYDGAPTPVTAFMSVGVKAAGFGLFVRLFVEAMPALRSPEGPEGALAGWGALLGVVAAATMTAGNVAALGADRTKRLLAYSSVAHAGYLLLGLVAGNRVGYTGLVISIVVYAAASLGVFGVLVAIGHRGEDGAEATGDSVGDFDGLARRVPALAALMTILLLGLGGVPPTAGFVGRFYLLYGLFSAGGRWMVLLAAIALVNTALSAYSYLRFVKAMYTQEPAEGTPAYATSGPLWAAVGLSAMLTIFLGVYPQPAIALSERAVRRLAPAPVAPAPAIQADGADGRSETGSVR